MPQRAHHHGINPHGIEAQDVCFGSSSAVALDRG
jgi:hypothetical protein